MTNENISIQKENQDDDINGDMNTPKARSSNQHLIPYNSDYYFDKTNILFISDFKQSKIMQDAQSCYNYFGLASKLKNENTPKRTSLHIGSCSIVCKQKDLRV